MKIKVFEVGKKFFGPYTGSWKREKLTVTAVYCDSHDELPANHESEKVVFDKEDMAGCVSASI